MLVASGQCAEKHCSKRFCKEWKDAESKKRYSDSKNYGHSEESNYITKRQGKSLILVHKKNQKDIELMKPLQSDTKMIWDQEKLRR